MSRQSSMPTYRPHVSVVIKTYDDRSTTGKGHDCRFPELTFVAFLGQTLDALESQTLLPHEVIVIDSSRGDGIAKALSQRRMGRVPVRRIPMSSEKFSHPRALNLGIGESAGEVVVSLSGDATPANDHWLENLVQPLAELKTAGAYSRQVAREGVHACLMERVRLWWRYRGESSTRRKDPIFSNASSAFHRSLAMEVPFNERLKELEDYEWAMVLRRRGYITVYAGDSQVCHSHSFSNARTLWRMVYYAYLRIKLHVLLRFRERA